MIQTYYEDELISINEAQPLCPKCGDDMWDNMENKKNPKGPDFKCKTKDCAVALWIYTPKEGSKNIPGKSRPAATMAEIKPKTSSPAYTIKPDMIMSYAKDLAISEMNRLPASDNYDTNERVVSIYTSLMTAIEMARIVE